MQDEKVCYLYYGENEYLIEKQLEKLITGLKIRYGNIYEEYLSSEIDIDTLLLTLNTLPLLTPKRIYILKNPIFLDKKLAKSDEMKLVSYFDNPNIKSIFILLLNNVKKTNVLLKKLADKSDSKWYEGIDQNSQNQVLTMWEEQYEKKLDKSARLYLLDKMKYVSLDILEEEFAKASLYIWGSENISKEYLKKVEIPSVHETIFTLLDGIFEKNISKAYQAWENLFLLKEPVPKVIYHLINNIKILLVVKVLMNEKKSLREMEKILQKHSFVIKKASKQSQYLQTKVLCNSLEYLMEIDLKLKTTQIIDDKAFMEDVIIHLILCVSK